MIKQGNIVCDDTGIVLEDQDSLYPGYLAIKDGYVYRIDNDGSKSPNYYPGVPKKGRYEEKLFRFDKDLNGKHFVNLTSLYNYYRGLDR